MAVFVGTKMFGTIRIRAIPKMDLIRPGLHPIALILRVWHRKITRAEATLDVHIATGGPVDLPEPDVRRGDCGGLAERIPGCNEPSMFLRQRNAAALGE